MHAEDRPRRAALRHRPHAGRRPQARPAGRHVSAHHPAGVHARRPGRRHRLQQGGVRRDRRARPEPVAGEGSAHRRVAPGLEGIRDGSHARLRGQLRGHLLDREPRSDGRAHRRLHHRGADADAHGSRVSAHARRLVRGHPRDRRGDRRVEHPVCRQPAERPHGRHRNEPAREPLLRAGVEGDRLPDREDRRQAGRRLHARRAAKRHHPRDAGEL